MGWLIGGQSLALLIGVPMASWIGAFIGWRGVSLVIKGGTAVVAGATALLVQRGGTTTRASAARGGMLAALGPHVLALLGASITERICFGMLATYFATAFSWHIT